MTPRLRSRPRFSRWRPELVSLPPKGWDPHSNPDAGSADADSEDLDGEAESAFDRVASLERAERIDLASPFELGEIAYKQNLYEGHPGYRWTLQPGPPPPVVDWTVRSLIPLIDWQLELYNILAKQHQGASALVTNAAGHLGGHLIRSLEVARAFERHQRPLQWTLDAIRSQTQSAFSTAALVRLELESRSLEARWQGLDRVRDRKMLAGRICLLAAAAYRTGAVLLMGSKEGEAESYIGSIVEILEAAFALGGVDPSLLDDIALYDLTTAMWSASTPPEPRIFLSQRGPDYRSKLMVELAERGLIRDGARPGSRRFPWLGPIARQRSEARPKMKPRRRFSLIIMSHRERRPAGVLSGGSCGSANISMPLFRRITINQSGALLSYGCGASSAHSSPGEREASPGLSTSSTKA
jgi:hypothetical protein